MLLQTGIKFRLYKKYWVVSCGVSLDTYHIFGATRVTSNIKLKSPSYLHNIFLERSLLHNLFLMLPLNFQTTTRMSSILHDIGWQAYNVQFPIYNLKPSAKPRVSNSNQHFFPVDTVKCNPNMLFIRTIHLTSAT